jgi:hypothetical protein
MTTAVTRGTWADVQDRGRELRARVQTTLLGWIEASTASLDALKILRRNPGWPGNSAYQSGGMKTPGTDTRDRHQVMTVSK